MILGLVIPNAASANAPPVANAGPDLTVEEGALVTLDGRASHDPDSFTFTYSWTQVGGPAVTLNNPLTVRPTFAAPPTAAVTVLTFKLTLDDGDGNTASDTVSISVTKSLMAKAINVSQDPGNSGYQDVAVSGANVYVAWSDRTSGRLEIYLKQSTNGGKTFRPPQVLTPRASFTFQGFTLGDSYYPKIAIAGRRVYVVWEQYVAERVPGELTNINTEIFLSVSRDAGASWDEAINLSESPKDDSRDPQIDASANYVHVLWNDHRGKLMMATKKHDGADGRSGYKFTQLASAGAPSGDRRDIAASGDKVYATWQGANDIMFASIDVTTTIITGPSGPEETQTITTQIKNVSQSAELSSNPRVAVSNTNGKVYVAWNEQFVDPRRQWGDTWGVDTEVFFASSADGGLTFGAAQNMSNTPTRNSGGPKLEAGANNVYLAWTEYAVYMSDDRRTEISFASSADGGNSFSGVQHLAWGPDDPYFTDLAADGDNVYVAWEEVIGRTSTSGSWDVFIRASSNKGSSFGDAINLSGNAGGSGGAVLSAANGLFYAAWMDYTPGNWDVYLRAGSIDYDLAVTEVIPVQAIYDADVLVQGKRTVVKATVKNGFPTEIQTTLALKAQSGDQTVLDRREEVTLAPGSTESFYLPIGGTIFPAGNSFTATVTIDPDDKIIETGDGSNTVAATRVVKDTKPLRILYVPVALPNDTAPTGAETAVFAAGSDEYIKATYPVSELEFESLAQAVPYRYRPRASHYLSGRLTGVGLSELFAELGKIPWFSSYDKVVGVVRPDWHADKTFDAVTAAGTSLPDVNGVVAERQYTDGVVPAHEIAHTFGWVTPSTGDVPTHMDAPASGRWQAQNREINALDFMNRYLAGPGEERWVSKATYEFLLKNFLENPADPPVIGISGTISKAGAAELNPWYRIESILDIPLANPGAIQILYLNESDTTLAETGFDISYAAPSDGGGAAGDVASFSLRIPDVPNTKKIVLKRAGEFLAEKTVSANSPDVTVTVPNGGEVFQTDDTITIAWQASDLDGGDLNYIVSLSTDAGNNWTPLEMDTTATDFSFRVSRDMHSESALVKVIATDGVNTSEDVSDGVFSIKLKADGGPSGPGGAPIFADKMNLSSDTVASQKKEIIASGNNMYVGWLDYGTMFFRASGDNGGNFAPTVNISGNPIAYEFGMAAAGSQVYAAWIQNRTNLFFKASGDNGATFGSELNISSQTVDLYMAPDKPAVAALASDVYVAWMDTSVVNGDIRFRASHDNGATFDGAINISAGQTGNSYSYAPQLAVEGNNVYVMWADAQVGSVYHIFLRASHDNGVTFGAAIDLGRGFVPRLAVAGGNVYAVFQRNLAIPSPNPGEGDILTSNLFITTSNNYGATFGAETELSNETGVSGNNPLLQPQLAVTDGKVHVVWQDDILVGAVLHENVLIRTGGAAGTDFGPTINLSSSSQANYNPAVAGSGANVYVAFENPGSAPAILFRTSTDQGATFGDFTDVSQEPDTYSGIDYDSRLAVSGNSVGVAWTQGFGEGSEVFFRAGTGGLPPSVDAGPDQQAGEGQLVLSSTNFTDQAGVEHTAAIDWGDGAITTGEVTETAGGGTVTGEHRYADNGPRTVKVSVKAAGGLKGEDTFIVNVENLAPSTQVEAPDIRPTIGMPITLDGVSLADAGWGDSHTATVDWGDGSTTEATVTVTDEGGPGLAGKAGVSGTHIYENAGVFTIKVRVADDDGGTATADDIVAEVVANTPPVAKAGGPYIANEGESLILDSSDSSDSDMDFITREWRFGERIYANSFAPDGRVLISRPDDFSGSATVTVDDGRGGAAEATAAVVFNNVAPVAAAAADQAVDAGGELALAVAVFRDAGIEDTHTAVIDWGDGTNEPGDVSEAKGSGAVSGAHIYSEPGTYTVGVDVADDDGGVDTTGFQVTVNPKKPPVAADDTWPPTGTININSGARYTKSAQVTLSLSASDPEGSPIMMRFRDDSGDWSAWEPFAASKSRQLSLIQGSRQVWVQFKDSHGNESTPVADTIFLDTVKPGGEIITAPFLLSNVTATNKIKLSWSADDPAPSSGFTYDVQFKLNSRGDWTDWKIGDYGTTGSIKKATPGTTYYFRVRAKDNAGNIGNWSTTGKTIVPFDQDRLVVSRRGFIYAHGNEASKNWMGTVRYSIRPNYRIKYKFTGNGVYLISTLGPGRGVGSIYVDGVRQEAIDTGNAHTKHRRVIFFKKWDNIGTHTLTVVNRGTPGRPRFDIDGLGVDR